MSVVLTDEQIRAHWRSKLKEPIGLAGSHDHDCYYALKRNARVRAGVQCDDEFSKYCEAAALRVACAIEWARVDKERG